MSDKETEELRKHLEHCLSLGGGDEISGNVMDALMASVQLVKPVDPTEPTDKDKVQSTGGLNTVVSEPASAKGVITLGDVRRFVALCDSRGAADVVIVAGQTPDNPYRTGFIRLAAQWSSLWGEARS